MIRRSFFQTLAATVFPSPVFAHKLHTAGNCHDPSVPSRPPESVSSMDSEDPEWLVEWQGLPRLPLLADDLPEIGDTREHALATLILHRIRSGSPFDFHYLGGSEPGKIRRVLPVLLFHTALDDMPCGAGRPNPIYLLAWCLSRSAPRNFRLDRMKVDIPRAFLLPNLAVVGPNSKKPSES